MAKFPSMSPWSGCSGAWNEVFRRAANLSSGADWDAPSSGTSMLMIAVPTGGVTLGDVQRGQRRLHMGTGARPQLWRSPPRDDGLVHLAPVRPKLDRPASDDVRPPVSPSRATSGSLNCRITRVVVTFQYSRIRSTVSRIPGRRWVASLPLHPTGRIGRVSIPPTRRTGASKE